MLHTSVRMICKTCLPFPLRHVLWFLPCFFETNACECVAPVCQEAIKSKLAHRITAFSLTPRKFLILTLTYQQTIVFFMHHMTYSWCMLLAHMHMQTHMMSTT